MSLFNGFFIKRGTEKRRDMEQLVVLKKKWKIAHEDSYHIVFMRADKR